MPYEYGQHTDAQGQVLLWQLYVEPFKT